MLVAEGLRRRFMRYLETDLMSRRTRRVVALGLVVFGVYGLCEARWRRS